MNTLIVDRRKCLIAWFAAWLSACVWAGEYTAEIVVDCDTRGVWLGPKEIDMSADGKEFELVVFRALLSDDDIVDALNASGAVDRNRILEVVGSSPEAYRAFKAWADRLGDITVADSGHAGDSYALGAEELFQKEGPSSTPKLTVSLPADKVFLRIRK